MERKQEEKAASAAVDSILNPRTFCDVKVFLIRPYPKEHGGYRWFVSCGTSRVGLTRITVKRYDLFVRATMFSWMKSLSKHLSLYT